jgi:general L-amino acid transport system permease protein
VAFLRRPRALRAVLIQAAVLIAMAGLVSFLAGTAIANIRARGQVLGFEFLGRPAGFDIAQTLIPYSPESTNGRVFVVGALNTLLVAGLGIIGASAIGLVAGLARLSRNLPARWLATAFVETARNIPLAIQILVWFSLTWLMPPPRSALRVAGAVLSNRGLRLPAPHWSGPIGWGVLAALVCIGLGGGLAARWRRRRRETGRGGDPAWAWAGGLAFGLTALLALGRPSGMDLPRLNGFEYAGGAELSPLLTALAAALATYTGAFIAEVVRGGVQSVAKGQTEAARSLGLPPGRTMRLIILPQALRAIVPPLASQYLNLTKDSSLAVIIGYPDLVSTFAGTALNQTGQAIETIFLTMGFFVAVSLCISLLMNWWNSRSAAWAGPR